MVGRSTHFGAATWWVLVVLVPMQLGASEGPRGVAQVGRDYYGRYCQVCHGAGGKGDGPYATLLAVPPADLTTIAKRADGSFSETSVAEFIDGRYSPRAHGTQHMPIWGRQLRGELPADPDRETEVRGQIYALIAYLRTLQEGLPSADSEGDALADLGWRLFIKRCASCHGLDGRGDGYLSPLLVKPPADLSTIAARRGSSFPDLEVADWIDGRRGRSAHGPGEMPVWGEQLGEFLPAAQGRDAAVRGEIQLLVSYLRSIQRTRGADDEN